MPEQTVRLCVPAQPDYARTVRMMAANLAVLCNMSIDDVEDVRMAAKGLSFEAPEGTVTIDGENQHLKKRIRVGQINEDGLIDEVWRSPTVVKPDPYLSTYAWAKGQ